MNEKTKGKILDYVERLENYLEVLKEFNNYAKDEPKEFKLRYTIWFFEYIKSLRGGDLLNVKEGLSKDVSNFFEKECKLDVDNWYKCKFTNYYRNLCIALDMVNDCLLYLDKMDKEAYTFIYYYVIHKIKMYYTSHMEVELKEILDRYHTAAYKLGWEGQEEE